MKVRRKLDLQPGACLDSLISECSVTRAADRVGRSQPRMSSALARLRKLSHDELLVRTARGMVVTPCACELAESAQTGRPDFEDVQADRGHILEWLTEGECDIAVGHVPQLPDGLRSTLVFEESLVGVAATHPPPPAARRACD